MSEQQFLSCTCLENVPIFKASYTLSQGVGPSTGILRCAPAGNLANFIGDLTLGIGSDSITIKDIVILDPVAANDTGGQEVILRFADPRYWWQDGEIKGHYNVRRADDSIDPRTEKTPRELATLLCQAIKPLTSFDVSALPNNARPEFKWVYANPAQELAKLCDMLNCLPAWWIDNTLKIVVAGQGALLNAALPSESRTVALTIAPRPDKIKLIAAPRRYQVRIPLECVMLDIDEKWKPRDDTLLKPADGWETEGEHCYGVTETTTTAADGSRYSPRELAARTFLKCYRPIDDLTEVFEFDEFETPSGDKAVKREHILPLATTLVDQYSDSDGSKQDKPAFCGGIFTHSARPDSLKNSEPGTKLDVPFSIDQRTGVITFGTAVYSTDTDEPGKRFPADIWLYAAVTVKDPGTRLELRFGKEITMPGTPIGTGPKILRQDDILSTLVVAYDNSVDPAADHNIGERTSVTVNSSETDAAANHYLDAAKDSYKRADSATDRIPWIVPSYRIDGAINQITWTMDEQGGATTEVSRGTQHDPSVPTYKERRREELLAETSKLVAQNKKPGDAAQPFIGQF